MTRFYFKIEFWVFFLHGAFVFSQSPNDNLINRTYDNLVGLENTAFLNGTEFKDEYQNANGDSRYFNLFEFAEGNIGYNGQLYSNVPLEYDIFSDNVITRSNDYLSNFLVKLIPEYISGFTIGGHDFVKLQAPNLNFDDNGFYEAALNGRLFKLYIKHVRKEKERTVDYKVQHSFSKENYYVVQNEGIYTRVNSIKDFKKIVPDLYKEVQKFRSDYKLLYKSDIDGFMTKLLEHLNGF